MTAQGNVGIAFALVIGAGLSTTLGASAALFAKLAAPVFLAVGLALSSGVMLYVSFVEIFMSKGVAALADAGWGEDGAYRYGTLIFFGGMLFTFFLDLLVHCLSHLAGANQALDATAMREISSAPETEGRKMASADVEAGTAVKASDPSLAGSEGPPVQAQGGDLLEDKEIHLAHDPDAVPAEAAKVVDRYVTNDHHRFGLQKMGLMTALAIGIHNLPEGLATFVAALSDPMNGVAIAVAIALHNIPEGVCVAMPVYYATGSRIKGFMWAFISGLSEPIGGLLGYYVLYGNRMSDAAYGVLFCIVSGMMTFISINELIPTALKYDPDNKVTSMGVFAGMVIMAASLLMFTI